MELKHVLIDLDNYINVTLRNLWQYEETYEVGITLNGIIFVNEDSYSYLFEKLKNDDNSDKFIKDMSLLLSNVFPDVKQHGISIITKKIHEHHLIKISINEVLYFDMLPIELLTPILSDDLNYAIEVSKLSTVKRPTLYTEVIKYKDTILPRSLYKWIQPKIQLSLKASEYVRLFDFYDSVEWKINYLVDNRFTNIPSEDLTSKFWHGKRILDFLFDTTANFDEKNGYPVLYTKTKPDITIFVDYSGYSALIKMRQFYPYFNWVPYEKEFAMNLYYIKYELEHLYDQEHFYGYYTSPEQSDFVDQFLKYIKTGKIDKPLKNTKIFTIKYFRHEGILFFLNALLYEKNVGLEYIEILRLIYKIIHIEHLVNAPLLEEYSKFISVENFELLKSFQQDDEIKNIVKFLN